ncbi:axonemal dynein light chain domain-containing protein 1-like isoform X2 [Pecten maximus]|uniref:axonemal dynein light chain domain-containing protein 1-like isoform X2 n=1 Tax=Pecten maximus TaxID=6579 RepID=UPI001458D5B2|nr:axonemal dynein light chain domain-containing protein 1-like isoform X2 [Pecten maximus]
MMSTAVEPRQDSFHGGTSYATPRGQEIMQKEGLLPELRNSENKVDRTKPLPTSLQSDFLPEDVLFALTQPPPIRDQLGPPNRARNLNTTSIQTRPPPASVWGHKRRERFKHLTENTPCVCGAGNDISFLYDVPKPDVGLERPDQIDKSQVRKEHVDKQRKPLVLPDTLIPDEYHIVKNRGVMGIEFHEDKYSNQVEDHEKHLVMFPSMKPSSRYEVLQLKKTLGEMLERAGVNDADKEIKGPTQMHNLMELIKKEQDIYNVVFHELIRQTSVECVERGELLADLRLKYKELLNKVPLQIKSLHEEVMAQRALDRRLTEELMRFKSTISILTSELSAVKEHDRKVTKEAAQAQEDLRTALMEAQKNASLLAEYHDLYELQRKRLEGQVFMLTEERELWSQAAYSLALKVTEEANLVTAKRLHVSEKSWAKLATHFTILLSDKDTELLARLQGHVEKWRDLVEDFNMVLIAREDEMRTNISGLRSGIERWMHDIRNLCLARKSTKDGHFIKAPEDDRLQMLLQDIRKWEDVLGRESEKFGGDTLLNGQEQLMVIRRQMDGWTDNALKVFNRHRKEPNVNHPSQDSMNILNEEVEELLKQFNNRITGENGVAPNAIHLLNALETWDMRVSSALNGTLPIHDNEWGALCQLMEEWLTAVDAASKYVGTTQSEEERDEGKPHTSRKRYSFAGIEVTETIKKVQKWTTTSTNAIDSEDAKLVEQVLSLHSAMVRWMVQMLLRLAPDREDNSKEASEMALLGSAPLSDLHAKIKTLFEQLEMFTNYVALCCSGIVMDNTQVRRDNMEENADHELKDLQRLRHECEDWIKTAKLLTSQLLGESVISLFPLPIQTDEKVLKPRTESMATDIDLYHDHEKLERDNQQEPTTPSEPKKPETTPTEDSQMPEPTSPKDVEQQAPPEGAPDEAPPPTEDAVQPQVEEEAEIDALERLEVIGQDDNTHVKTLDQTPLEPVAPKDPSPAVRTVDAPDTHKAFQALTAMDSLQTQLIDTEERAQKAEERAAAAETDLATAEEKLRELEKKLMKYEQADELEGRSVSVSPSKAPASPAVPKDLPETKEEKKRPESQASKGSSKSKKKKDK